MGTCQSKSAAAPNTTEMHKPVAANQSGDSTSTHIVTDEIGIGLDHPTTGETKGSGSKPNQDSRATADTAAATATTTASDKKTRWHEKPGYSSGASSFSGDREETDRLADPLQLKTMRDRMHSAGDLTQTVVRMETPFGKPIDEIYDGVYDGQVLGQGVAGTVRRIRHRTTGVEYACKELDISGIDSERGLRQLRDEISIMCQLDHPNIVRIEEVYEETNKIYLVQELCLGGELYDRLDQQTDLHYTEATCARLVKQIVSAVRYLHSKGVIHRDLKLENFLFTTVEGDSELKMIDFGLSKHFEIGDVQNEQVGSRYTCAPEILKGRYDEKCDVWAIGVITYLLLCGDAPFGGCYEGECIADVKHAILSGDIPFEPADIWEDTSDLSKKFVRRLLQVDPAKRPTAREVQRDDWLRTYASKDAVSESNVLNPRIVQALVNFKGYSEMRRLLHEVLSFTLLPEQIVELREEFEKIDNDNDGEITLAELQTCLLNAGGGALGGLTEAEVEDLFDALKVNKNDTTIRWHGFIAAGLSQCQIDNRNLQLAFDRLDVHRKGYVTFDDLTDLLGTSPDTLKSIEKMWKESMHQCGCKTDKISYDDFILLMKGQSRRESYRPSLVWSPQRPMLSAADQAILEELAESSTESSEAEDKGKQSPSETQNMEMSPKYNFGRKRSKSFDDISWASVSSNGMDNSRQRRTSMPANTKGIAIDAAFERSSLLGAPPLLATREQYKKHRELRMAIIEASKEFDSKTQSLHTPRPLDKAGLIMKRGSEAPQALEEMHQRALFDAAIRRSGRQAFDRTSSPRHRRKRTQSDVTGLMTAGLEVEVGQ